MKMSSVQSNINSRSLVRYFLALVLLSLGSCTDESFNNPDNWLLENKQIIVRFFPNKTKTVYYWIPEEKALSFTMTSCTSSLRWSVSYSPTNETLKGYTTLYETLEPIRSISTWCAGDIGSTSGECAPGAVAARGLYAVHLRAQHVSAAHVYTSAQSGGAKVLRLPMQRLRVRKNKGNDRVVVVKWNKAQTTPYYSQYCVLVSIHRNYTTLCEAQQDKWNVLEVQRRKNYNFKVPVIRVGKLGRGLDKDKTGMWTCFEKRTKVTLTGLARGRDYNVGVYGVDKHSGITRPLGLTSISGPKPPVRPIPLRDSIVAYADLQRNDGKAVFRHKAFPQAHRLLIWILPCGESSSVDVEVTRNQFTMVRRPVLGVSTITVLPVPKGSSYRVKISRTEGALQNATGVQVIATSNTNSYLPLPILPKITHVYAQPAECEIITIGWVPATAVTSSSGTVKPLRYCVYVRAGTLQHNSTTTSAVPLAAALTATHEYPALFESVHEIESFSASDVISDESVVAALTVPNEHPSSLKSAQVIAPVLPPASADDAATVVDQCGLDKRLRSLKSVQGVTRICRESSKTSNVLMQRISHLKPGTDYIIQVVVSIPRGRSLSYNLLQARTKDCHQRNRDNIYHLEVLP